MKASNVYDENDRNNFFLKDLNENKKILQGRNSSFLNTVKSLVRMINMVINVLKKARASSKKYCENYISR